MADLPRLNNIIRALEAGQHALTCFAPAHVDSAIAMSASKYDGCVFEMEHNPWDSGRLRDCLQYMLNRAQIAKAGLVPPVTPMVRIPVNGVEMAQWQAKQALDIGCYGIVFPHISTVEEAANAVGACRYPRLKNAPLYEPAGIRGDGPTAAARYWGLEPAGVLPEGRRLAAQPAGRDLLHPADRGHPRRREPRRHAEERAGHRRDPDRRRRPRRRSSAIRASTSTRSCWSG